MKPQILAAATALAIGLTAVSASAQDTMDQGHSMLTGAVYNMLTRGGFETDHIDNLTLSEITQIRRLLTEDMGSSERQRVQLILDRAAEAS